MIILTEDRDFNTAREAIETGADSYLLKPIEAAQLEEELLKISGRLTEEKAVTSVFTVENIFRGCLNGQLHPEGRFHKVSRAVYGFTLEEPAAVFAVWLGDGYRKQRRNVCGLLEEKGKSSPASVCVLTVDVWQVVTAVIYRIHEEQEKIFSIFRTR